MNEDATGNGTREAALSAALEWHREAYQARAEAIEADVIAGRLSRDQAADAMRTARLIYDRACDLSEVAAATGWETWVGVGGILYGRRPKTSPPKVVRAPPAQALREAIEAARS